MATSAIPGQRVPRVAKALHDAQGVSLDAACLPGLSIHQPRARRTQACALQSGVTPGQGGYVQGVRKPDPESVTADAASDTSKTKLVLQALIAREALGVDSIRGSGVFADDIVSADR